MKNNIQNKLNSKRVVRWLWVVAMAPFLVLGIMLTLTAIGTFGQLPTFEELENPRSDLATELYSEDGRMIGMIFTKSRSFVDYADLNDSIVAALVSTEDARYYGHSGIDFQSLARVAFRTVGMGQRRQGGGSTITQQLAKNLFPRDTVRNRGAISKGSRLMVSKLKEWITAVKLERNYTKEEIIAMYLNTMDFSSNAVGIKAAAQTYFYKAPGDLTINEAATLVGIVNATTRYNPYLNPDNALRRRNTILERMYSRGFIDSREKRDSLQQLPILLNYHPISHDQGTGTYFRMMVAETMKRDRPRRSDYKSGSTVRDEWDYSQDLRLWESNPLEGWLHKTLKADGTPYDIYRDGLKIYTTINSSMQEYAEQALWNRLQEQIQPMMDRQYKASNQIYRNMTRKAQDEEVFRKYRRANRDIPENELGKKFETAVPMRIFTYQGDVDTLMTPRDSMVHYELIMRASFVAMDPTNGHVKAYVGGPDYRYFQYDMVRQGKRQVGSTIKPFIYTFGIDHLGLDPCTPVQNVKYVYESPNGEVWDPGEAGGEARSHTGETRPLWWGLALSRNNFSVWIMRQGKNPEAVADFIHNMGVHSYIDPVPALCLGTPELSLWELVGAYTAFANSGVHTEPIFVTRIEDKNGNVIATFTPTTKDAISARTAYTMLQMIRRVIDSGTAGRLRGMFGFTGEMAGKTGTNNDNRDAWFVGVTPKLVGGAWVGNDDQRTSLRSGGEGSAIAMPIFGEFLKKVYDNPALGITQKDRFPVVSGGVGIECTGSTYLGDGDIVLEDEFFD